MNEERYMNQAIALAERGIGFVNPNPLVGAVIVKGERVIGQGWHERFGGPHAEKNALQACSENPEQATLYVTLEPCCHYGRTPPCTDLIIQSKIKKVVIGCLDPNPLMSGKSVELLRKAGIKVITGVLKTQCEKQNEIFHHYIRQKRPFVMMKYAMTLDGKIAAGSGPSRHSWISGEASRQRVHQDRKRYAAIMVGVGTVVADNPSLTCRLCSGTVSNPVRIICDTNLRTPLTSELVQTAAQVRTILVTAVTDMDKKINYQNYGCDIIAVPKTEKGIDLKVLMSILGEQEIDSVLLEGGSSLNFSALQSGIVNKIQAYIAPKIFGGETAKTPVGGAGFDRNSQLVRLKNQSIQRIAEDILIEAEVEPQCLQES